MTHRIHQYAPELIELELGYRGTDLIVARNQMGYRVGYVRVPQYHPHWGKGCTDEDGYGCFVNCHGGITYGASGTEEGEWWIGFDCAHAGDAPIPEFDVHNIGRHYTDQVRSQEYVLMECESIIDQLHKWVPDAKGFCLSMLSDPYAPFVFSDWFDDNGLSNPWSVTDDSARCMGGVSDD